MPQVYRPFKSSSAVGRWQRWALNLSAAAGSVCLLLAAATLMMGLKPLVFASGSMAPAIPTGSLALAVPMPAVEVQAGEVVSVINSEGARVTYRVESYAAETGLVLKGDANPVADLQPYAVDSVDRVLFSVPVLGFVVAWFSQPWLFFVAGMLCAMFIYLAFIRKQGDPPASGESGPGAPALMARGIGQGTVRGASSGRRAAPRRPRRPRGRGAARATSAAAVVTSVALFGGLGMSTQVASTEAAFIGTAAANAAARAVTAAPPQQVTCTNHVGNAHTIRFDWAAAPPGVTGYIVTAHQNGSLTAPKSTTLPADARSYVASLDSGLLGTILDILNPDPKITITISAMYGSWKSAPVSFPSVHATSGILGINKKLTCTS
ncbi:hypothetical protein ACFUCV_01215 [Specibacter sp. NPDC057265]|uniref:hypothetical protein n=1 Tax=Specibacter sp. NPDC057265 TaxID=3346075 RepID=UPI00363D99BD